MVVPPDGGRPLEVGACALSTEAYDLLKRGISGGTGGAVVAGVEGPGLPSPFQRLSVAGKHLATPPALPCTALDRSRWARPTAETPPVDVLRTRLLTQFPRDPWRRTGGPLGTSGWGFPPVIDLTMMFEVGIAPPRGLPDMGRPGLCARVRLVAHKYPQCAYSPHLALRFVCNQPGLKASGLAYDLFLT
jgi:hypothetical protein